MYRAGIDKHRSRFRVRKWLGGRRITRTFETLLEAEHFLDELERVAQKRRSEADARLAAEFSGRTISVTELCRRWFTARSSKLAPGTAQNYERAIRLHIGPSIGEMDANLVTDADLEAFYRTRRYDPARKAHQVLRSSFTWGRRNVEALVRIDNPALCAKPSRRDCAGHDGSYSYDDDDVRPVDEKQIPRPEEIDKLLVDAESRNDRAWWLYVLLAVATAGRPGEICALRRGDIDLAARTAHLGWSADRASLRVKRPKTRWSIRTIELPAKVCEKIAPHLPADPQSFLLPPDRRSPMPCWNGRGVIRRLTRALQRLGLPHYTPHGFRHYTATTLLAAGASPTQVGRFLGHKDDTLVRKLYGNKISPKSQRSIAEILDGLLPL